MSLALETVCAKLALKLTDDPATRLVASKIIEPAQRGVQDVRWINGVGGQSGVTPFEPIGNERICSGNKQAY